MVERRKEIIRQYVEAYNAFDIAGMVKNMSDIIVFKNVIRGKTNLKISGIHNFIKQAEEAGKYFTSRKQDIVAWEVDNHNISIEIDYSAIFAKNIPDGPKKGDTLTLHGKSTFVFEADKISVLIDES